MVFSPNTSIFRESGDAGIVGFYVFPMFVAALVVSGIIAIMSWRDRERFSRASRKGVAFAVLYGVSDSLFAFFSYGEPGNMIPVVVSGALCGATLVIVCIRWASRFVAVDDFRKAILLSALLCIFSAVVSTGLSQLPSIAKPLCFTVLVAFGALTPFVLPEVEQPVEEAAESGEPNVAGLISMLRLPVIGLLLYAFMMSFNKFLAFDTFDSEYVGGCIAALCLLPLFAIRTDKPLSSLIYRVVVPAIGGVVIVLSSFSGDGVLASTSMICVYVFLSMLAIFAMAEIIAIMHAGEYTPAFVTSLALALGSVVSLAGLIWVHFFGGLDDYSSVITVMVSLYCAVMLVCLGWESWNLMNASDKEQKSPDKPESAIPKSIESKLSGREFEILKYLDRGHSMIYIAEKLFISESTVRTHVKHIYAKLGVHSREELFELMDGRE